MSNWSHIRFMSHGKEHEINLLDMRDALDTVNKLTEDEGEKCPKCQGSGQFSEWGKNYGGMGTCPACNGSGVKGEEKMYPCVDCGKLRTKDEGGTTFTVCDECWEKSHPKPKPKSLEDELIEYKSHCEAISGKKGLFACQGCREEFADFIRTYIKEIAEGMKIHHITQASKVDSSYQSNLGLKVDGFNQALNDLVERI